MNDLYQAAHKLIEQSNNIVVLQADNPDGDSLASSLALEEILETSDSKKVTMVCGIDMPAHLRYLDGWDRVQKDLPPSFDLCIVVDCNTPNLFETLAKSNQLGFIKAKPLIVIDHHGSSEGLDYANVVIVEKASSTGEVIYSIFKQLGYEISIAAMNFMAVSIMSDSLGLTSDGTTVRGIRYIADMVEAGVSLSSLDDARRELMKREPVLLKYKAELLNRIELINDNKIAVIVIPWTEIEKYSSIYNPSMLAIDEMRMTIGVQLCIAFKLYPGDTKVTAKIRCVGKCQIADKLAEEFGGGGHPYAAGFKLSSQNQLDFTKTKQDVILKATQLLEEN